MKNDTLMETTEEELYEASHDAGRGNECERHCVRQ
jgi:hypothetical protein